MRGRSPYLFIAEDQQTQLRLMEENIAIWKETPQKKTEVELEFAFRGRKQW